MTPHRHETNMVGSQPMRFYKYVALSFLLLTLILLGIIVFMSAKRAVITITTRPEPLEVKEAINIGSGAGNISGAVEMTNVSLQKSFQPKEGKEVAVVVTGEVILHNEEDYGQPLVATTRLLTATGIMFRLKDRVVVPAKGTVTAAVYADQPGKESEIGPSQFTIPGLSVDKQKVIYATSDKAMVGGVTRVGILGQSDWQEATQELQADLEKAGKEKLSVLHPDLTVAYKLVDLNVTSKQKVGEETSGFTLAGTAKLVGVFYNNEEVKTLATKELNKRLVSDNEVLAVDEGGVAVVISDYNTASSTAAAELSASGRVSLNSESRQLDKSLFYGKNKDEVRRYLLSLDHVQGVEIKFTPAWMRTVPAIADHVSVIVKLTE